MRGIITHTSRDRISNPWFRSCLGITSTSMPRYLTVLSSLVCPKELLQMGRRNPVCDRRLDGRSRDRDRRRWRVVENRDDVAAHSRGDSGCAWPCADRRLPAARRVAERHAVCRRPLRTWRSRSTLRFGFPDSRARSQPAGLPSAWSNGSRLSSAVSTYPSAPIARLEAPSIEARSTNHRKEPECASASHDWPAGKRRAKVVSGRLSPSNAVVVVDLAAVVVGVLGHASLRIARSLFELLLRERYDVAFETGVVLQHAPRDRVAIRAYAEKATELKRRIAHLARELVDD